MPAIGWRGGACRGRRPPSPRRRAQAGRGDAACLTSFFALLAEKQIKRGAHTSVKALIKSIEAFIARQNANPKPLRWTKSADDILASVERFCRRTLDVHAPDG